MQNGMLGFPRNGNQEILTLNRGPDIGFTISARYGDTGLQIPVPTMRPTKDNSVFALDLAPKGPTPVEFAGNGYCWLDVCDADVQDANSINGNPVPVRCARVAMTSTGAQFGCAPFNGATALPVEIITNYNTVTARFNSSGLAVGSATRTPVSRIEATDDTIVSFMNVFSGEGVVGTSTNHPYSIWTNNVKRAIFDTSGYLTNLLGLKRTGGVSIEGTNTNDNAASGQVGEVVFAQVLVGSAVALNGLGTPVNITSISVPAGDWDISAQAYLNLAASTSWTNFQFSISGTSATIDVTPGRWNTTTRAAHVPGASNHSMGALSYRLSLASTTTIYLVAQDAHTISTAGAWGFIMARRAR